MTTRLSMSSLAGIARTLVAVGTARLVSMLATTRAAAPRRGLVPGVGWAVAAGLAAGLAGGAAGAVSATGSDSAAFVPGAFSVGDFVGVVPASARPLLVP